MDIRIFGGVRQLAYVPSSMDAALQYWTRDMGVGPFYMLRNLTPPGIRYRGQETHFDFSVALAYWGDMQIELIEQHDDVPSIYSDWLRQGHEGLHHICLHTDDIEEARRRCEAGGGEVVQEFLLDDSGALYVDFGGGPGTLVEILQMNKDFSDMFEGIRKAAHNWDGTRAVREIDEL